MYFEHLFVFIFLTLLLYVAFLFNNLLFNVVSRDKPQSRPQRERNFSGPLITHVASDIHSTDSFPGSPKSSACITSPFKVFCSMFQ